MNDLRNPNRFACSLIASVLLSAAAPGCATSVADNEEDAQTEQAAVTTAVQVDCGGGAVAPFSADQGFSGGNTFATSAAINITGVANAAPAAVYQSERYGNHSYTFGNLTPNTSYTLRLHFAEIYFSQPGKRVFNVLVNDAQVITNLDLFASVGQYKALVREVTATSSSAGQLVVRYQSVVENAKSSGIEILSLAESPPPPPPPPPPEAPRVATAAAANANPTSGTTTRLSVLGADDGGETNLSYTWATAGTPPAAVSFSVNGSNAAKQTTATFSRAGSYDLRATLRDSGGLIGTSTVTVVVQQQLSSVVVSPASVQVAAGATQRFSASARDQFGNALTNQPSMFWSASGGGSIDSSGLFSASASGGPFTITASNAGRSGIASVSVTPSPPPPPPAITYSTDFNLNESPISEAGRWRHTGQSWSFIDTLNGIAVGKQPIGPRPEAQHYNDAYAYLSGFPANQRASGVVHKLGNVDPSCTHEVELLLRWSDSASVARGYEVLLSWNGQYTEIVRWNGPYGNYTPLANMSHPVPTDGATFSAEIVGNRITAYLNGSTLLSVTDNTWTDGNPGIGLYRGVSGCGSLGDYGYKSFSATSLP